MHIPKTLMEAIRHYSDEQVCIDAVAVCAGPKDQSALLADTKSTTISSLRSDGSARIATSNSP